MRWFDSWFRKQCKKAWYTDSENGEKIEPSNRASTPRLHGTKVNSLPRPGSADESIIDEIHSYIIKMQPANGGTILQVSHYDKNNSDWIRDTYVITDENDLGSEINKILVQYKLKHC